MTNQDNPRSRSVLDPVATTLVATAGLAIARGTVLAEKPTATEVKKNDA